MWQVFYTFKKEKGGVDYNIVGVRCKTFKPEGTINET